MNRSLFNLFILALLLTSFNLSFADTKAMTAVNPNTNATVNTSTGAATSSSTGMTTDMKANGSAAMTTDETNTGLSADTNNRTSMDGKSKRGVATENNTTTH